MSRISSDSVHAKQPGIRRFIQNMILLTCSVLVALALAELFLRLFVPMEKSTVIYDSLLGLRGRPNVKTIWTREIEDRPLIVRTNSRGFHDIERNQSKDENVHRIVFIGDSYTEAYQVPLEKNFVRRLEYDYTGDSSIPRVEHINAGLHTWGLGAYYLYVKHRVLAWNPDTVVVCLYTGNDFHDNYYGTGSSALPRFALKDGELKLFPAPGYSFKIWLRDNVAGRSSLVRLLWTNGLGRSRAVFNMARHQGLVGTPEIASGKLKAKELNEIALIAERQIIGMNEYLRTHGVKFMVFIIPDPRRVNALAGRKDNTGNSITQEHAVFYERHMLELMRREKIPVVYPLKEFMQHVHAGREIYLNGGGHFSSYGHRHAAIALRKPLHDLIVQSY